MMKTICQRSIQNNLKYNIPNIQEKYNRMINPSLKWVHLIIIVLLNQSVKWV